MNKDNVKKVIALCIDTFTDRHDSCDICEYSDYHNCQDYLCRDALAIIDEQDKEIEKQNSRVKVLKNRLNEKYALISNMERKIYDLKDDFESLQKDYEFVRDCDAEHCLEINETVKQAKIDVLNELKKYLHIEDFGTPDERWKPESEFYTIIDELIKEIEK